MKKISERAEQAEQAEVRAEVNVFIYDGVTFISLPVPGFGKNDIDAYMQDDKLVIEGERTSQFGTIDDLEYSDIEFPLPATFRNKIKLERNIRVSDISVENGLCLVQFEKIEADKTLIEVN